MDDAFLVEEQTRIEKRIGKAPRKFSWFDRKFTLKCALPKWDWKEDPFNLTIDNWENIFKNGKFAWAYIIQVNTQMFSRGEFNCPGELLVCTGDCSFEKMEELAQELFALKGNSENIKDEEERDFALHLEDEMIRNFGLKVPKKMSDDMNHFVSVVYFQRKHLPNRCIDNSLFPILYDTNSHAVVVIPDKYWSDEFLERWKGF